jgi:hypothetical protein
MNQSQSIGPVRRPDGRVDLEQPGYPDGPQGPSGGPGEGKPLRTPEKAKPKKATRSQIIKIRLTNDERNRLVLPLLVECGARRGLSQLVRTRLFASRPLECSAYDCRQFRLLAAIGNNLNLVARRSLELGSPDAAVQVIAHLASLEREIRSRFKLQPKP